MISPGDASPMRGKLLFGQFLEKKCMTRGVRRGNPSPFLSNTGFSSVTGLNLAPDAQTSEYDANEDRLS